MCFHSLSGTFEKGSVKYFFTDLTQYQGVYHNNTKWGNERHSVTSGRRKDRRKCIVGGSSKRVVWQGQRYKGTSDVKSVE